MQTCSVCFQQFPDGQEKCSFCSADALTVLQAPPPPGTPGVPYTQHGPYPQSGFNYPVQGYPPQQSGFISSAQRQMPVQPPVPQKKSKTWLWVIVTVVIMLILSAMTYGGVALVRNAELEKEAHATATAQTQQLAQTAVAQATASFEATYGKLIVADTLTDSTKSQFHNASSNDSLGICRFEKDGYHVKETAKRPFTCLSDRKYQNILMSVNVVLKDGKCAALTFRNTSALSGYIAAMCANGNHWLDVLEGGNSINVPYENKGVSFGKSFAIFIFG